MLELLNDAAVARARLDVRDRAGDAVDDMLEIVRIPAPSFEEQRRGEWLMRRWQRAGFDDARLDAVGNVIVRYGSGPRPLVVAAHIDTVFARDVELTVRRRDGRLEAPGIADNARGVAAMLAVAEAIAATSIRTSRPIAFVGTVCEEGAGDLRGVKHLLRADGELADAHAFIALDGSGIRRIVHRAVGSRRFRCLIRGPGGHSWADRGAPNALHAAAQAIAAIAAVPCPESPASALNVTRAGGGISINAIPGDAWFEVDARSESPDVLTLLDEAVRGAVAAALGEGSGLAAEITVIGDRPAGGTAADSALVRAAISATQAVGSRFELVSSSTDANVPMARGIPAIAIGAGGESGNAHSAAEWYSDTGGAAGLERALLAILLADSSAAAAPAAAPTRR
jgi:tripeptide aminopeptidase